MVNKRDDQWGGSLENRARIVFEVVKAVKAKVSQSFCLSIKLNSADFQKGGFSLDDAKWLVEQLNEYQLDLVELSGGSYESPAMSGNASENISVGTTARREAYFLDFAKQVSQVATLPIMLTGGITKRAVAEHALSFNEEFKTSIDMLGIARAMAYQPDLAKQWQRGKHLEIELPEVNWKNKTLGALANMSMTKAQLCRMAKGKPPKPNMLPLWALIVGQIKTKLRTKKYRKWRKENQ